MNVKNVCYYIATVLVRPKINTGLSTYLSRPDQTNDWIFNLPVAVRPSRWLDFQLTCRCQTKQMTGLSNYLQLSDQTDDWIVNLPVAVRPKRWLDCQITGRCQTKQKTEVSKHSPVPARPNRRLDSAAGTQFASTPKMGAYTNPWNMTIQCNTTLLPSVKAITLGRFCGAKYTHHAFTSIIKYQ